MSEIWTQQVTGSNAVVPTAPLYAATHSLLLSTVTAFPPAPSTLLGTTFLILVHPTGHVQCQAHFPPYALRNGGVRARVCKWGSGARVADEDVQRTPFKQVAPHFGCARLVWSDARRSWRGGGVVAGEGIGKLAICRPRTCTHITSRSPHPDTFPPLLKSIAGKQSPAAACAVLPLWKVPSALLEDQSRSRERPLTSIMKDLVNQQRSALQYQYDTLLGSYQRGG
ncbi:hypothetical protein B0H11DRAFT_1910065 [Mycena galericulata]|nr:hypothetical protein B0H11DRAFT_1910065 [Mycena galericulata]